MKSFFGHTLRAGLVIAAFCVFFPTTNASATNSYIKIDNGSENLYVSSGTKSNTAGTATYNAASKTLKLQGYNGGAISADVDNLVVEMTSTNVITTSQTAGFTNTGSTTIKGGILGLGSSALVITNGNLTLSNTDIIAKSISLDDTDSAVQNKIYIQANTSLDIASGIGVRYNYNTTTAGIILADSLCVIPNANIITIKDGVNSSSTFSTNGTTKATGIKVSKYCTQIPETSNPDTADNVLIYIVLFVASSAALLYRRYLAKR